MRVVRFGFVVIALLWALPGRGLAKPDKPRQAREAPTSTTERYRDAGAGTDALLRGVGKTSDRAAPTEPTLRGSSAGLGSGTRSSLSAPVTSRVETSKSEEVVSAAATARSQIMAKRERTPHERVLDALREKARAIAPRASGRLRISYAVGIDGKVHTAMVIGFDRGLDDALTEVLEGFQMPRSLAGQQVATQLDLIAAPAAKPTRPSKRPAKKGPAGKVARAR